MLVNATPLKEELVVAPRAGQQVVDLAYLPDRRPTALVAAAQELGCQPVRRRPRRPARPGRGRLRAVDRPRGPARRDASGAARAVAPAELERDHARAAKNSLTSASGDAEAVTTGDQVAGLNALAVAPLAPNLSARDHAEADEAVGAGVVAVSGERCFEASAYAKANERRWTLGHDVVVEVEDVVGVVASFDLDEPVVVGAVGCADGVVCLVVAEVVEPASAPEVRL